MQQVTNNALIMGEPDAPDSRLGLLSDISKTLKDNNISFGIINGYEPETKMIGRDIDIIVKKDQLEQIIHICQTKAKEHGWPYVTGRWIQYWFPQGLYQTVFYRITQGKIENLAFDFICSKGIAAGVVPVYASNLLGNDVEFHHEFPITPIGSYTKNLIQVLAGHPKGIGKVETLDFVPSEAKAYLTPLLGKDFLDYYERCVKEKMLSSVWKTLRRKAQRAYLLHHPLEFFKIFSISLIRKIVGRFSGHVITVAVVGPDGVGKSTTISKACHYLEGTFFTIRRRHWRPRLLPNLSEIGSKKSAQSSSTLETEPSNAPRRHPGRFGGLRLIYYYVDYVLGHIVKDRYSDGNIVVNLYDRAALDMYVDPLRYGLSPNKVNRWVHRFSPKPNWVILLSDSPNDIFARKPELSNEEISRQISLWTALFHQGIVNQIISVGGRSADEVGLELATAVLEHSSFRQDLKSDGKV